MIQGSLARRLVSKALRNWGIDDTDLVVDVWRDAVDAGVGPQCTVLVSLGDRDCEVHDVLHLSHAIELAFRRQMKYSLGDVSCAVYFVRP